MGVMYCAKCDKHVDLDTDIEDWDEEYGMCWDCWEKDRLDLPNE